MLIASRPIAIRALEQSIPDDFTVMKAAAGDQTAKPLEEAKHGDIVYAEMRRAFHGHFKKDINVTSEIALCFPHLLMVKIVMS
jgi:hypothetical protein